jgi:chromosome segregation ATPase
VLWLKQRKIASARQKTDEVAEKLRLAELELTKRQSARDPATLRDQLERVRTEKVTLDQQLQASEHRAQQLETEKEDLARRLALLSLDKTAKKRWSEAKHLTNQSPVKPTPMLIAGASSVAIAGGANTACTSNEVRRRVVHQEAKKTTLTPPTPPARPDDHSVVSRQMSPLASSTLTNLTVAERGDVNSTKKHRPPPPAR